MDPLTAPKHRSAQRARFQHLELPPGASGHSVGNLPVLLASEHPQRVDEQPDYNRQAGEYRCMHGSIVLDEGRTLVVPLATRCLPGYSEECRPSTWWLPQ